MSALPFLKKEAKVLSETFSKDLIEGMEGNIKNFHLKGSSAKSDTGKMEGNSWTDEDCIDLPLSDMSPGD